MILDEVVRWTCQDCGEEAVSRDDEWVAHAQRTHRCPPKPCPHCGGTEPCQRARLLEGKA